MGLLKVSWDCALAIIVPTPALSSSISFDCGGKVSKRAATCPHCGAPKDPVVEFEEENEEE